MTSLRLTLFGLPRIERDGVPVEIARRKALALLAYLALSPTPQSREHLAELLWPERDAPSARADLRSALFAIRRAIGAEWLEIDGDSVALRRSPGLCVDIWRFRDLLAQATGHIHTLPETACADCIAALAEAAALYTADFLAGFSLRDAPEFDNWQTYQTETLRLDLANALERLARLQAVGGDYGAAIASARRWLELDPLCEEPHRALIRLHAEAGNRAAALHQYAECVRVLDAELGVRPDVETTALRDAVAGGEVAVHREDLGRRPPLALPPDRAPFIGREEELAQIAARLADPACRLLTVLGPGGSGKTRLAVAAARVQAGRYPDGIFFVDLTPVSAADQLAPAIAQALAASPCGGEEAGEQLVAYLRDREILLLLDNFEHLLEGAGLLPRMLEGAPGVHLLVTSRARLNLVEEWLLPLEGLALAPEKVKPEALAAYSATALFLACVQRLRPGYRPDPKEALDIARVCRLLSGMPLGIELAAARARTLSPEAIAAELARGLDVLATTMRDVPERHRSMAAAFDGSWRLLSPHERHILRCASVFRGGFTAEAAGVVAGAKGADLEGLVDSCWLRVEPGGRWGMHELIRQYCEAKLKAEHQAETGDDEAAVQERHVAYFRWFILEKHVAFQMRPEALTQIEPELGNLMAAWEGLSDPADLALMRRVTAGLDLMADRLVWWPVFLPLAEQNIRRFQDRLVHGDHNPQYRRRLELAIAWNLFLLTEGKQQIGGYGDSHICLDKAEALLGDGDPDDLDWAQTHYMIVRNRAWLDYLRGNFAKAEQGWLVTLEQLRSARIPVWVFPPHSSLLPQAEVLLGLAWGALESGWYDPALAWAREAVEAAAEFGSPLYEAFMETVLVACLAAHGEFFEAERVAKRVLRTARKLHATEVIIQCLPPLAALYSDMGRPDLTRIWAGRCVALCEDTGYCESGLPWALVSLTWAELELGHIAEARRNARRAMELIARSGGAEVTSYPYAAVLLGRVALVEGRPTDAADWLRRAVRAPAQREGARVSQARLLADIRRSQGHPEDAVALLSAALHTLRLDYADRRDSGAALRDLAAALPPDAYAAAVARGESNDLERLIADGLNMLAQIPY
jgi:DNA-binding SARP family transcriptional activator